MNKIPVYLCIAILLGQVMLFSSEDSMNISSEDSEFDIENTVLTSGRNDAEDAGWVIETVETSSSQGSWVEHGKYNSLAVGSNGTPHISYISAIENNYVINHTSFDGQTWNSNTVATSSGGPCSALDSLDNPHVGLYTTDSSGNGDLRLATNTGQSPSSWTLEMIDNSSSNVGSNCDMKVGPDGDIYVVYWKWEVNNHSLKFAHYDGNSWTTSDIDNDGGSDSSLQIDDLGNLHVSYRDLTNGGLKYGINNGQGWVLSTIEGNGQGRGNSLVLDSNNDPHVSYFDGYNNRLKYASLTGTSWSISTVEAGLSWGNSSNTDDTDTSIGIDSSGNVHISYFNAGLKYAFYDGTSWNFTLIDTVENIEGNTNLIVDDEQRIHISYHDKENKSLKYAFFEEETTVPGGGNESITSQMNYNTGTEQLWANFSAAGLTNGSQYNVYFILTNSANQSISSGNNQFTAVGLNWIGGFGQWPLNLSWMQEGATYCMRYEISHSGQSNYISSDESCVTIPSGSSNSEEITPYLNFDTTSLNLTADIDGSSLTIGDSYEVQYFLHRSLTGQDQLIDSGLETFSNVTARTFEIWDEWVLSSLENENGINRGDTYCLQVKLYNIPTLITTENSCVTIPTTGSGEGGSGVTWSNITIDSEDNVGMDSSLAIDSWGWLHISYSDATNADLKYATDKSGSWVTSTIDSDGYVGLHTSLAIDSNGDVHISYRDATNEDLKYATFVTHSEGGSWHTSTIDSDGNVGVYTSLAIDSNDDVHISYSDGTYQNLKYATDKSGSWVTSTIDSDGNVGSKSSLAIDSNDKVHISYRDNTNTGLKYATDKSGSWVTSTIDSVGNVGYDTSLAIDSNGDVHISYRNGANGDLKYATDKSGSWVTSTIADDSDGNMGVATSLAIDSNDDVHISYWDSANGDLKYAADKSGSWVTSTIDSDGNVGAPSSLAIDSNNDIHISYRDATNGGLKYITTATSSGGEGGSGVTWSNMTIDSEDNVGMDSSLAIDSNGKVHISYRDSMADLKYATDKSGSWVTSTIDSDGIDSSLAIDSNGDVHISYYNVTSNALMYATDKDGSWVTSTIDSYWDVGMMSSLAIDSNDDVHISYYDDTHQDLKYATDKSGSWVITSTIDSNGNVGKYTSLAIDSNDDVHISYYDNTTDDLKYATDKSGSWATTMVDSLGNVGLYTSLAIDSNDNVHISYYHAGNGNLMYAFKNAAGWGSGAYDSDGNVGYDTSLAIDSNGDVHISYRDGYNAELKYATYKSGSWVTSTIADDSTVNMGVATSLAIDSNDDIHISYYHAGNGDLKYITTATSSGGEGGSGTDTDGSPEIFTSLLDTSPDNDLSAAFQVRNLSVSNSYSIEWALATVDNNCGNDDGIIELPSDNFGNDLKASPYNITSSQIFNGNSEWIGLVMLNESMHPFDEYCLQVTLYENGMLVSNSTSFIQRTDHRDTDGDGVSNSEDDCPGTLSDVEVDVNGCFIDSSGDNSEEDLLPDDWYADIPVIGSLIEQAQTKYGKYAGVSVLSVTVLGYLYRGVTMRSEYKMNKRVKKFKKLINRADSAKELRRIQADLENADEKRLLPRGALGDLLSLIELRAEDLGLTDFITQDALIEAGITQEDLMAGVDALNQAREDLASAQFEADKKSRRGSAPSISQRDSPKTVATATLRGSAKGGGVKRPSYHPKDLNRDGSVDIDDERMWAEMSESEREEKRRESARTNTNIAGQVVAFSKLPPNLKSRCHCGKKKAYYKCHFKKDKCPCGSGKKFYQCCAKSRGY